MLTLLSTLISFLAGGLPKLLGFFQDKADKKHEMAMAQLQTERELELRKAGFEAAQRVEEIKVEGQAIEAEASWHRDIAFDVLIAKLWDADTQIIFASIISFHFGGRAFKSGKD